MRAAVLLLLCAGCQAIKGGGNDDARQPADEPPVEDPTQDPVVEPRIFLNEICSSNKSGLADEIGGHPDWIELYNPGADDFSLAGLSISDNADDPGKHTFDPGQVVPAGGFLVLFADGNVDEGVEHVAFELDADGDDVGIYDGVNALSYVRFGPLLPDTSMARIDDGGEDFVVSEAPTPGEANGATATAYGRVNAAPLDRCRPTITVADPYPVEGETMVMDVGCDTGDDAPLSLLTARAGPALDGDVVTWSTGPADAGTVDVLIVVDGPGVPETARGTAWVVDGWEDPANVQVDPQVYTRELGVPVLYLDPASAPTQDYQPASAWFDGVDYEATMKIRGATSLEYPKASYTLEFEPQQIALDDLGLGHKDHLVLISNFDDSSYIRQKLVFDTWAALADASGEARLAPRTAFVVVYLSGEYQGLYTAIDHVDDEFVTEMGFDGTGNVYKSIDHDANFYLTNRDGDPKETLHDGWEKKEGVPDDFTDLDALTEFTGTADHATFVAEAGDWLVETEFMDWLDLVHWFAASDSGGKNAYLFHDPASGRFRYAPWDFNSALGQNWYTERDGPRGYNDFVWTNRVFWQLVDEPSLMDTQWRRFADQRAVGAPFDPNELLARIDGYYALIGPSAARDWDRWSDAYWETFGWARTDRNGYQEEREYVEQWIVDRAAYMETVHP